MSAPVVPRPRPRWLDVVGILGVVGLGFTVWLGLWVTPPDKFQGNLARLLYIHPAVATVALYWVGIVAAGGSLLYLWPRTAVSSGTAWPPRPSRSARSSRR